MSRSMNSRARAGSSMGSTILRFRKPGFPSPPKKHLHELRDLQHAIDPLVLVAPVLGDPGEDLRGVIDTRRMCRTSRNTPRANYRLGVRRPRLKGKRKLAVEPGGGDVQEPGCRLYPPGLSQLVVRKAHEALYGHHERPPRLERNALALCQLEAASEHLAHISGLHAV